METTLLESNIILNEISNSHSTDTFYGIICSGLTPKTKLSHLSSNSSFSECVRKHSVSLTSYSNNLLTTTLTSCVDTSTTKCFTFQTFVSDSDSPNSNQPGQLDLTQDDFKEFTSFGFFACVWTQCKADYGGGIYLTVSNTVTLSVINSQLYFCTVLYRGGGIYTQGLNQLSIYNSLFSGCSATATSDNGGGGIETISTSEPPLVERSAFISCISGNDGGGVGIYYSTQPQRACILQSRFIACEGQHSSSSGGGGMIISHCNSAICSTECFFSACQSAWVGGGICYWGTPENTHSSTPLCSFSFFSMNSALTSPYGHDIYFYYLPSDGVCIHCFSTTTKSPRIHPSGHENWLPMTNISEQVLSTLVSLNIVHTQVYKNEGKDKYLLLR